jgi:hypothetical protein
VRWLCVSQCGEEHVVVASSTESYGVYRYFARIRWKGGSKTIHR